MPFFKYSPGSIICILLAITSCKNKDDHSGYPASVVEANPAYKPLNDSIHAYPGDASLYLRRATRLTQESEHELAYDDFHKSWTLEPSLENGLPFAANLEILARHDERLGLLESVQQKFPSNAQVGRLLADAYASDGKADSALAIYNAMIAKDSLDPETHYEKAMFLEQLKDTVRAIASLQKAYSIQGVDTYGLELANLYAEQNNPRAIQLCDFILKKDSAQIMIDPFFIKGIYYSNTKQYPRAIAQFDSCILRDWKTTDAYLEKGRAYFHMQNFNAAMQTFNMAITVSNSDPDAYFWLGRCYEAQHRKTDAIVNYRKAVSLDKDFTEAKQRIENLEGEFAHPSH